MPPFDLTVFILNDVTLLGQLLNGLHYGYTTDTGYLCQFPWLDHRIVFHLSQNRRWCLTIEGDDRAVIPPDIISLVSQECDIG